MIKKERPPPRSTPLADEHTPGPNTQQFNATPRFNFSSTPRPSSTQQTLPRVTPSAARYLAPLGRTPKQHEAIELSSEDGSQEVQQSIEREEDDEELRDYGIADIKDEYQLEEPSTKRRRLSSSPPDRLMQDVEPPEIEHNNETFEPSSSLPILSSPPAPRRPVASTAPRFLLSTPAPQSTPRDASLGVQSATPFLRPPRFRPPDPSEAPQSQSDPLPEQFSPHRKGSQKYVAGGLAAEVRDWLINLDSAIPDTRGKRERDEPWLVKVVIDEVCGSAKEGMTLVRGRQVHLMGREEGEMADTVGVVKIILAGEGMVTGLQKGPKIVVGDRVGIKGPVWEAVIEGEKWGVGVEWKVLR